MFERFTDRARRVMVLAQDEARLFRHESIGTDHLLLGLIHEGQGVAAVVLAELGITLDKARAQLESIKGRRETQASVTYLPFTLRCKKVLELSLREGLQLGHNYIGPEHILLAIIREGEGVAAQILTSSDVELQDVREAVIRTIVGYAKPPPIQRYVRAPDGETLVDATLPGVEDLLNHGWALIEHAVDHITCAECGTTHICDRYVVVDYLHEVAS